MATRAEIVAEALEWVGTPTAWGQCAKGRGADCKGLIFGIARELGMPEAQHPMAAEKAYRNANSALLLRSLDQIMTRTKDPKDGDVMVIMMGDPPRPCHLGLRINDRELVHCYGRKIGRVARVPIGRRPVHSWWTWPSLEGS